MSFSKTALIFYTGNVCSTPLVQTFNRVAGFEVPIHEHLDQYMIEESLGQVDISRTFNSALKDIADHNNSVLLGQLGIKLPETRSEYLALKWRPFGGTESAIAEREKIFDEINSVPFLIARSSVVHQAVKIALSEKLQGTRHLQFSAKGLSQEKYQDLLLEIQKTRVVLSEIEYLAQIARNFLARTKKTLKLARSHFPSVPINIIRSEDLFTPMLEESLFLEYFSKKLNFNLPGFIHATCAPISKKAGYSISNCINLEEITSDPTLMNLEKEYASLLDASLASC